MQLMVVRAWRGCGRAPRARRRCRPQCRVALWSRQRQGRRYSWSTRWAPEWGRRADRCRGSRVRERRRLQLRGQRPIRPKGRRRGPCRRCSRVVAGRSRAKRERHRERQRRRWRPRVPRLRCNRCLPHRPYSCHSKSHRHRRRQWPRAVYPCLTPIGFPPRLVPGRDPYGTPKL